MRAIAALLASAALCLPAAAGAQAQVVDDNIAAVSRGPGAVHVFARGSDGAIYERVGLDGSWRSIGGNATSGPAALVRPDGIIDVFARGTDGTLQHAYHGPDGWSAWESLGGMLGSGPGAIYRKGSDTIDVLVAGTDGAMYHRSWQPAGGWSQFASVGGVIHAAPAPSSRTAGILDIYVRAGDDQVMQKTWTGTEWTGYGGLAGQTGAAPSVISRADGDLDVFVRNLGGSISQRHFSPSTTWSDWVTVTSETIDSAPGATVDGNRVHLFARRGSDVAVTTWSNAWSPWRSLGPSPTPPAPPAPPSPPGPGPPPSAPAGGGNVEINAGLSCTPRGERMAVSVKVRKRAGRAKPRVQKVVFYYRKGKRRIGRTDRTAPYRRSLPIDLRPGIYRVYARISYKRPGKRRVAIKTVSKRFAVCS